MDVGSGSGYGAKALGMYLEERVTEVLLLQAWTFKLDWLKARLRGVFGAIISRAQNARKARLVFENMCSVADVGLVYKGPAHAKTLAIRVRVTPPPEICFGTAPNPEHMVV